MASSHNKQPEAEIFGRRLRELRNKKRMTQEDLAAASGLTSVFISNLERGLSDPSLSTIVRLAGALRCKVAALVSMFDRT